MDIEKICGNCSCFTGEECEGKFEGSERYHDSEACEDFDWCGEIVEV